MKNGKWAQHAIAGISLVIFIVLGLASATQPAEPGFAVAVERADLDGVIRSAAEQLARGMANNTRVAVVSMQAGSVRMSDYLINELTAAFVGMESFAVVNRFQLDLFAGELHLDHLEWFGGTAVQPGERAWGVRSEWENMSPEGVAQSIGRYMGLQSVVMGTFEPFGDFYRFRAQVFEVETGTIRGIFTTVLQNDYFISSLLGAAGRRPPQEEEA